MTGPSSSPPSIRSPTHCRQHPSIHPPNPNPLSPPHPLAGLYDIHIRLKGYPVLEPDMPPAARKHMTAAQASEASIHPSIHPPIFPFIYFHPSIHAPFHLSIHPSISIQQLCFPPFPPFTSTRASPSLSLLTYKIIIISYTILTHPAIRQVMSPRPFTFRRIERVGAIYDTLQQREHDCFPVLNAEVGGWVGALLSFDAGLTDTRAHVSISPSIILIYIIHYPSSIDCVTGGRRPGGHGAAQGPLRHSAGACVRASEVLIYYIYGYIYTCFIWCD